MSDFSKKRRITHDYEGTARGYAVLGIEGTFYIAYRELDRIIKDYSLKGVAIDVGCGGGRSTRFLKGLGFESIGVDIEPSQIEQSRDRDPSGDYRVAKDGKVPLDDQTADVTLSCIVLLESPSFHHLKESIAELARITKSGGKIIVVTNSEESYQNNWASFNCDFPENQYLQSGRQVKVLVRGAEAVFYDYYWSDEDYRAAFSEAGLRFISLSKPLADGSEPFEWVTEMEKPNWSIYLLERAV